MAEAKAREYFHGALDHFLVPATEVPESVQLVFGMDLLKIYSLCQTNFVGLHSDLKKGFLGSEKTFKEV